MQIIQMYTDGSCHTQLKIGSWVSLLLIGDQTVILKGTEKDTTHNRMEILAVLKGFEYLNKENKNIENLKILSDSKYVVDIVIRKEKLKCNAYLTKEGKNIQNVDLVEQLIFYIEKYNPEFIKVPAHQKETTTINYNREADKIVRKMMRDAVKNLKS